MNRNKEVIIKLLIVCSLYTVATGISQMIHRDNNNFNADKFKVKSKGKVKIAKVVKRDNFNNFMKMVNDGKIKILKKQILRKERMRQQELKRELLAKQKSREIKIANEEKREIESKVRLSRDSGNKKSSVSASRGGNYDQEFDITFYTSLDGFETSSTQKLRNGICASNNLPQGSRIQLEGYGETVVEDCGGSDLNNSNRLDIYIARNNGESDQEYNNRALSMGRKMVRGRIIK